MSNGAESPSGAAATWVPILCALIALGSATLVVVLTSWTSNSVSRLDRAATQEIARQANSLEVQRLSADLDARRQDVLRSLIPRLTGTNPHEKQQAITELLVLYPNDAQGMLRAVMAATGESANLAGAVKTAGEVAQSTGEWGIVFGSDTSEDAANDEVQQAKRLELSPITIFHRQNLFASTLTGFVSRDAATAALVNVQAKIRPSAFVVQLNDWCPSPRPNGNVQSCG